MIYPEVLVRKYQPSDRQAVREICCATAFMGKPCANFFDGDEIFADALTGYFTDYEPQSCFVAEKGGLVIGYLIGAKDVKQMNKVFRRKLAFKLLAKAFFKGTFLKLKNLAFFSRCLSGMVKGQFRQPDFSGEYPATLHINLLPEFRGLGIGSQLIAEYLKYLKGQGVKALHFATMSEKATKFFNQHGFMVLFRSRRSYFRHLLNGDVFIYIYGIKLS